MNPRTYMSDPLTRGNTILLSLYDWVQANLFRPDCPGNVRRYFMHCPQEPLHAKKSNIVNK